MLDLSTIVDRLELAVSQTLILFFPIWIGIGCIAAAIVGRILFEMSQDDDQPTSCEADRDPYAASRAQREADAALPTAAECRTAFREFNRNRCDRS